uniref:CSON011328 protein n=1 Tax=Culicoides sonorensis TaxID=179676 RepID=A0A336KTS2_CULSO
MDCYSSDSESVVSGSTFEDYENSGNISFEFRQSNLFNYLADVNSVIQCHDDITIENGLSLNAKYKQLLEDLRTKFEQILIAVKEKYAANEELLDKLRNHSIPKNPSTRNVSIYICGAPYFKDSNFNPGPSNADYIYRKNVKKEFFPIDFLSLPKVFWTANDKKDIVRGVKEQILNKLKAGTSSSISEIRNTQKCSRSISKKISNIRESTVELDKKPFLELYKMVENDNFTIDWNKISFKNLDSRHTPNECMAMWNHYLKPGLNHGLWSEEEEEKLQDAIIRYNYQDWEAIAKCTNRRSPMQCFVHYRISLSESAQVKKHEKFSQFEDQQLLELVDKFSEGETINWSKVCQQMPGRNRYQCYHRYMFTIKPGIKRDRFTTEEDCAILAYVQAHGETFGKMPPNLLPGRTPVQIRNRYNNTLKVADNKQWTVEEDQKLMDFVDKNGTSKWSEFAKQLGTKTRFACRCRYITIQKFLTRNPTAKLQDVPRKDKCRSTQVNMKNYLEKASELKESRENPEKAFTSVIHISKSKSNSLTGPARKLLDKYGLQLYQYFRLNYNWRFRPEPIPRLMSPTETLRTFTILQLLDLDLDLNVYQRNFGRLNAEDQSNLTLALDVRVSEQMKEDIRFVKSYGSKLPVNLNTILAWRAMNVLTADRPNVKVERPQFMNYVGKYQLFMRRFKQMFYWTAILSKIDFRLIKDRITKDSGRISNFQEEEEVSVENNVIFSDDELVEDSHENEFDEIEVVSEPESDEENAVDFLLGHIKNKSVTENDKEVLGDDENTDLDMPNYFDDDNEEIMIIEDIKPNVQYSNVKNTEPHPESTIRAEKRKNESSPQNINTKKQKKISPSKSMPLT